MPQAKTNLTPDEDKDPLTDDSKNQQPASEDANERESVDSPAVVSEDAGAPPSAVGSEDPGVHWTPEWEIILFNALVRFRPVGVHKHFRMLSMQRYFRRETGVTLTIQQLWNHLSLFYDLGALDAMADESDDEITFEARRKRSGYPFKVVAEFSLPGDEFDSIISEHRKAVSPERRASHDSPRSTPEPHSGNEGNISRTHLPKYRICNANGLTTSRTSDNPSQAWSRQTTQERQERLAHTRLRTARSPHSCFIQRRCGCHHRYPD
ncbi:chromatin modification-related protein EAF7-domain-containing protein [Fimicolochytrium jonesii]|uniref:chromatin modification-related protein EAF7-domain-containing protein n=1 Tax=Fimicolochytrium jonesii TaxID=1396493 RepID=UPI0022FEA62E|nr:chromatin modification-related protein EAF7-domain-containing protein [Fimicolochytrium jonesii]KAI8827198.1 chromatin modification-related protein EAF7-domain-containing protein [Fimicolochytrium jonesii]